MCGEVGGGSSSQAPGSSLALPWGSYKAITNKSESATHIHTSATLPNSYCCGEMLSNFVVEKNCTAGAAVESLDGSHEAFSDVEVSDNLPQPVMPHSVEGLFEVDKVVE